MPITPRIHNLGHNVSEHSPARWLFFDTETDPTWDGDLEVHALRLWAAELVERAGPSRRRPRSTSWSGITADTLADAVEDACRSGERLHVCAHNLGFDLVVTQLPLVLADRGWEITQHAVTGSSPWLRCRRGSRSITMVDSHSWLPLPLQRLGELVGTAKPALPAFTDADAAWAARCAGDVAVLRDAVCQLLDWWDANRLGHFSLTGPATGFNAYRHLGFRSPVVVDPDPDRRAVERGAVYAGRMECWRVGVLPTGAYAVLDFQHAFGSVCATQLLPRRQGRAFDTMPIDYPAVDSDVVGIIAEVEVETATPRYPFRTRRGIVHPVGRFRTTLAGPEIAEARRRGELRAIGPGHVVALSRHMERWARWALAILDDPDHAAPPMAGVAVKAWTRTVPGRWAGRTGRTIRECDQPVPGWRVERGIRMADGAPATTLDMAGRRYWIVQDVDMDNAFPAVLAWIQSVVRVRLNRLIDLLGEDNVVTCNTDGLVVDLVAWHGDDRTAQLRGKAACAGPRAFAHALTEWAPHLAPLRPRVKCVTAGLEVISPQHLITDTERQLAGVPRGAEHLGDHRYTFRDWPGMTTQLDPDSPAGYARRRRVVDLGSVPILRWRLLDGRTAPPVAAVGPDGTTTLLPFTPGALGAPSVTACPVQHPALPVLPAAAVTEVA